MGGWVGVFVVVVVVVSSVCLFLRGTVTYPQTIDERIGQIGLKSIEAIMYYMRYLCVFHSPPNSDTDCRDV